MVEIINLSVENKNIKIKNINLHLNKGEVFGIVSLNEKGKSLLIKAIKGLIPYTGQIIFKNGLSQENIGYLSENFKIYGNQKISSLFNIIAKEHYSNISEMCKKLKINLQKKINELSYSEMKKIGIINALASNCPIVILDSPFNGMDEITSKQLIHFLKEYKAKEKLIIITDNNMENIAKISDRIGIISNGKINKIIDTRLFNSQFYNVIIYSTEYKKLDLPMKNIKLKKQTNEYIEFLYTDDINNLMKLITKIKIKDIQITKATIKDIIKI